MCLREDFPLARESDQPIVTPDDLSPSLIMADAQQ